MYTDPTGHRGLWEDFKDGLKKVERGIQDAAGWVSNRIDEGLAWLGLDNDKVNINNASYSTNVAAFGNGGGGSGDFGFEYVGPGSGGRTQNILELTNPYNVSSDISFNLTVDSGDYLYNPEGEMYASSLILGRFSIWWRSFIRGTPRQYKSNRLHEGAEPGRHVPKYGNEYFDKGTRPGYQDWVPPMDKGGSNMPPWEWDSFDECVKANMCI